MNCLQHVAHNLKKVKKKLKVLALSNYLHVHAIQVEIHVLEYCNQQFLGNDQIVCLKW